MITTDRELQLTTLAMKRYKLEVEMCENRIYQSAKETGVYLRLALIPILHRWGMGMRKGGALVYPEPSIHRMAQGVWEVHTHKATDYALGEVHPELSDALWTPVDIFPYEDTFHDYIEDIPLPLELPLKYMWIVQDRGYADTWCTPVVIDFTGSDSNLIPGSVRYFGPVTKEYVEDVTAHGLELIDFMYTLPQYIVNGECEWELHTNEVTG
jgi:hypothetical protein